MTPEKGSQASLAPLLEGSEAVMPRFGVLTASARGSGLLRLAVRV